MRRESQWTVGVLAGVVLATLVAFALGHAVAHADIATWLYLPIVLIITLHWGRRTGIAAAVFSDLLVLLFTIQPLFSLTANDRSDYVELGVGTVGTIVAALLVGYLNERLLQSERQQVQASEQSRAQERFQALIEHSADGVQLLSREGRRLYVSPSTTRVIGFTPEELLQRDTFSSVEPEDRAAAGRNFMRGVQQPGSSRTVALRVRHKDGSWRWIESTTTNLLEVPSVQAMVVNFRDITARREIEEGVRRSRDELATILASVGDGITVQDAAGTLVYANPAAARMVGFATPGDLLKHSANGLLMRFDLIDEAGDPLLPEQLPARRVLAGEASAEATIGYRDKAGAESQASESENDLTAGFDRRTERWSLVTASPVFEWRSQTQLVISVFRDITDHRRLAEAQREAIEIRDRFLSTASHELRTPLTTLKGQVQLSLRRLRREASRESLIEGLEQAEAQAERLNRLIADLLDVSRLTSGRMALTPEPMRAEDLCARIVETERGIEPYREIRCTVEEPNLWIMADPLRLEQVLVNLLQNARKYSADGAPIVVTLSGSKDAIHIAVRDEGIGIPPDDLDRIFTAFHRAGNIDRAVPGLGLGLAIAHDLVQAHDGELAVVSEPGAGSTFTVTLPRCKPPD